MRTIGTLDGDGHSRACPFLTLRRMIFKSPPPASGSASRSRTLGRTGIEMHVYQRPYGKWGWRLTVDGGVVATDGNQGYDNENLCREAADQVVSGRYSAAEWTLSR